MISHLTTGRMIELAAAVLLLGAGIYFYRRRDPTADKKDNYGAPGRGDPVRRRRDHAAPTRSAASTTARARPRPR